MDQKHIGGLPLVHFIETELLEYNHGRFTVYISIKKQRVQTRAVVLRYRYWMFLFSFHLFLLNRQLKMFYS